MASKGGSSHLKRISSFRTLRIAKKTHSWLIKAAPGPHRLEEAIPLGVLVRDYLNLAANTREIKYILNHGEVFIDGRLVKDPSFPVGLMDVVTFPKIGKGYKIGIDDHGRFTLNEVSLDEAKSKLCKIRSKVKGKKGAISLGLHDGKTVPGDNNYSIGDSVKVSVPENKIEKLLKLEPGARCLVVKGKHAGKVCKLKEFRMVGNRKYEAHMEEDGGIFITTKPYLFVVE
ncbi:MAG: 30S ribosomal protein S4e [Candidatus Micrarchaeota archaeon]